MTNKALVIEDDPQIRQEVIDDVLSSLGFTQDWARCQQEAKAFLKANQYDLILLDLQIPVRVGGQPNVEFGKQTLGLIQQMVGRGKMPVVVMTGFHKSALDMAVELHKLGATDFISKPFPLEGRTLTKVIEEALQKFRPTAVPVDSMPVGKFTGGQMVFYKDSVELCGLKILGCRAIAAKRMLEVLAHHISDGKYRYLSGDQIAKTIDAQNGIQTVTGCARTIRNQIAKIFKLEKNIDVQDGDVLEHSSQGYRLNHRIQAQFCDNLPHNAA